MNLQQWIDSVGPLDAAAMAAARERQAMLAKPPGSLGRLEELSIQLAGITGRVQNSMEKQHLLVFAADNGVVEEGVASTPQIVTLQQTVNLTRAKTGASALCKHFGCGITVVDVGVMYDVPEPKVLNRKIAYGTANMAKGPAMTIQQAERAILTGIETARDTQADVLGVGEMGIGNTTTSAAVLAVLLDVDVDAVTGRGGGLTDEGFARKKQVLRRALALHHPDRNDVLDVLSKVGGLDIAAMTGAFLGCAHEGLGAAVDGYISVTAALCAVRLCPAVKDYLFLSHQSYELGYRLAAEALELTPCLALDMRLGEGSGCPLLFRVMEGACGVMANMATFPEAAIEDDYLAPIRSGDSFTVEGV